ncbi:MAG: GNAT family N-acetyltransferase [Anaerolineae bacterium]
MKLTAYMDAHVFDELKDEWNLLVEHSISNTIFLTWEWQSTWWNSYESGDLWVVACRDDEGKLVGLGPWFIHQIDGERVVRTIGCVDVTDYVDVIAHSDYAQEVQTQLAMFLRAHNEVFDRINLCNIPEQSPTLELFPPCLEAFGFNAERVLQEVCPIINLPENWEGYLEALDKKQRHEIRRKLRRMEEAQYEYVIVNHTHDLQAMIDQFLALMRASHPEKARFLDDPHNTTFFKRILPVVFARGWLKLSFLVVEGKATATYCDFDYGGNILVYNSGLLPDESSHLSPGIVLLSMNIRDAIEKHHRVFDFLRGNETYKYRMGATDTRVYKLRAHMRERVPQAAGALDD